jgi:hypothetical protein
MKKILAICVSGLLLLMAGCSSSGPALSSAAPTLPGTLAPVETLAPATAAPTQEISATPTAEPTTTPTAEPAAALEPLGVQDLELVVDGEYYDLQTDVQSLIATLGDGYNVKDVKGKLSDGTEKQYIYPEITITTFPSEDIDVMYSVEFSSDAFDTARGVHVGSTPEEVKAAFGDGFYEDNGALIYTFDGKKSDPKASSITFKISNGAVTDVLLYNAGEIQ